MPEEKTHADAVRLLHTSAASDKGAQSDPDACLGGWPAADEAEVLNVSAASLMSNITIDYISGNNEPGTAYLDADTTTSLKFKAPGSASYGASVTIANGETKIVEDGDDPNKYIRVTRTTTDNLTGTATLTLTDVINNVFGLDDVSSAEAAAGDTNRRCIALRNVSTTAIANLKVWLASLGTDATADGGQLPASGAGTITTTDSFADWPAAGFACILNGTTTREIVYYTSRTDTVLTVPAAGRGAMGTSAGAGAATDECRAIPGSQIWLDAGTAGQGPTMANEDTDPAGVSWAAPVREEDAEEQASLAADTAAFLYEKRHVIAGATAQANVLNAFEISFDSV